MRRLCVFCGSSTGNDLAYIAAARELAGALVAAGHGLVYGGAHRGLMGVLADAMLARGGDVIGVIPAYMAEREIAHRRLTQLLVVQNMHERKATMAEHSAAFLALPGGFGTLDELMEAVTWRLLGLHDKPCGLLNTQGYFDPFIGFIDRMTQSGFVREEQAATLRVAYTPAEAIAQLLPPAAAS